MIALVMTILTMNTRMNSRKTRILMDIYGGVLVAVGFNSYQDAFK